MIDKNQLQLEIQQSISDHAKVYPKEEYLPVIIELLKKTAEVYEDELKSLTV